MFTILVRELIAIACSAALSMAAVFVLVVTEVLTTSYAAYTLMFLVYAHLYGGLRQLLGRRPVGDSFLKFEVLVLVLTAYMVLFAAIADDWPDAIALPACYWTFAFIAVWLNRRALLQWFRRGRREQLNRDA